MTDLVKSETAEVAERPTDLLSVIAQAVADPRMDVEKMNQLFELQQRIVAEQRKVDFDDAMARLQAKIPQIEKFGKAKNSKYVKYEDLKRILNPLLAEEHFSMSFNEESSTDTKVTFALEVSRGGHSKFHRLTVNTDRAAKNREGQSIRPAIQDDGSTASYARRYLVKLAFDIVEKDEDTDGHSAEAITDDQVKTIETLIQDTNSDTAKFLTLIAGVDRVVDILQRDYRRVINALETKQRDQDAKRRTQK